MHRTRVKFCGITNLDDALAAAALGVDALGFVFFRESPRFVEPAAAADIIRRLPAFLASVGLFVDQDTAEVAAAARESGIQCIQFHGNEPAAACGAPGLPYVKAVRMRDGVDLPAACAAYSEARALLLDTYVAGVAGGSGRPFDWRRIPADLSRPLILAGGLDAGNVAAAIRQVRPYGVDVSGGIESAKGKKDAVKMAGFIREVRRIEYA